MKLLKYVFALIALSIALGAPIANAQQQAKRQSEAQKLQASLNLTDDQYKQVDAILKDATKQKRAVPKTDADKKKKDREITAAAKAKVREVLTPEQRAKYDEASKRPGNKGPAGKNKSKGDGKKKKSE